MSKNLEVDSTLGEKIEEIEKIIQVSTKFKNVSEFLEAAIDVYKRARLVFENQQYSDYNIYKINPGDLTKINELPKVRFDGKDDFLNRAIDMFLTWELDPIELDKKMNDMAPTPKQFAYSISMGMNKENIENMYKGYPKKFGKEWDELKKNPKYSEFVKRFSDMNKPNLQDMLEHEEDLENAIKNLTSSQKTIKNISLKSDEKNRKEFPYDDWPVLSNNYSRILPAKIGLLALGELITENNGSPVNFIDFKEKAYDLAYELSKKLKEFEEKEKIENVNKFSTGFPKINKEENENKSLEENDNAKEEMRQEIIYQERYMDRNFGKIRKSQMDRKNYCDGLMSALGLIHVFEEYNFTSKENEIKVTFTENGRKLYMLENPIFVEILKESKNFDSSWSSEEKQFIIEEIIPQRKLEHELMKTIRDFLKTSNSKNSLEKIEAKIQQKISEFAENAGTYQEKLLKIIENTQEIKNLKQNRQTPIDSIRVAVLGRMAELDLIVWETNNGKSEYSLGKQNLKE